MTLSCTPPRREHAVEGPLADPAAGERQLAARPRAPAAVSMMPVTRELAVQAGGSSRPVSAARSSRENRSSRSSAPHLGGSSVTKPCASTVADLAGRERRPPPGGPACPRSGSGRAARPAPSSEGKARRMPSNESGSSMTSVARPSVSARVSRCTVPVEPAGGRSPSWCWAVPLKVTFRSGPSSVPTAVSRPSRITAGASRRTVRRSMSDCVTPKSVKVSPLSREAPTPPSPAMRGHRIARHRARRRRPSRCARPARPGIRSRPACR